MRKKTIRDCRYLSHRSRVSQSRFLPHDPYSPLDVVHDESFPNVENLDKRSAILVHRLVALDMSRNSLLVRRNSGFRLPANVL